MALLKANTGIGTTNPTAALHVFGNSICTGIITAQSFSGTFSGTATTAITSGYASTAGIATVAQGLTGTPNITVGVATAISFVKSGGTSSQFLKADGSVDTSTYLTTTDSGTNLTGIVTSIIAGTGITVSGSTGQVTINSNQLYYRLNSDNVGLNNNAAQSILGVGVSLNSNTVYEFEGFNIFTKTAGTTSHNFQLSFGGTATINNIAVTYHSSVYTGAIPDYATNTYIGVQTGTSAVTAVPAIAGASRVVTIFVKGSLSINQSGTFIPQYVLSAAPGGAYSTKAGSYFKIYPIGTAGANSSVGSWS